MYTGVKSHVDIWANKVAGGFQRKVANTVRHVDSNNQLERSIVTTLFEVDDLQQQLIVQRAAAIAQDVLYQGSVFFTFPAADFPDCTTFYALIQEQLGRISKMGTQQLQDLIVEVQFDQANDITRAVTIGVIHKKRWYKGTPTNVGTSNTLVKLLLNSVPWSTGLKVPDFAHQMIESLGHYGRVCQLRKHCLE